MLLFLNLCCFFSPLLWRCVSLLLHSDIFSDTFLQLHLWVLFNSCCLFPWHCFFFFWCRNEANVSDSLLISSFSSSRVCSGSAVHRSACRHHRHLHLPSSGRAWAPAHLVEEWADFGAWGTRQTQEQQQVMTKASLCISTCLFPWDL